MKNIFPDNNSLFVVPPEPIDENEFTSLSDIMASRSVEAVVDRSKTRRFGEEIFQMKIGGTTYEVSTHFNPKGRQCIFEQFKELILSENLL
ncbi:MAG: transposon-encoded TnpW family protein [Clostridia bacterium]|nr:transposon-encoded TnpW family protein [Clostridia bacterium]